MLITFLKVSLRPKKLAMVSGIIVCMLCAIGQAFVNILWLFLPQFYVNNVNIILEKVNIPISKEYVLVKKYSNIKYGIAKNFQRAPCYL